MLARMLLVETVFDQAVHKCSLASSHGHMLAQH